MPEPERAGAPGRGGAGGRTRLRGPAPWELVGSASDPPGAVVAPLAGILWDPPPPAGSLRMPLEFIAPRGVGIPRPADAMGSRRKGRCPPRTGARALIDYKLISESLIIN